MVEGGCGLANGLRVPFFTLFVHASAAAFLFWEAQRGCFWISPEGGKALTGAWRGVFGAWCFFQENGGSGCALSVGAGVVMEGGMIESLGLEGCIVPMESMIP